MTITTFTDQTPKDVALVETLYAQAKEVNPWMQQIEPDSNIEHIVKRRIWLNSRIDALTVRVAYDQFASNWEKRMWEDLLSVVREINNA